MVTIRHEHCADNPSKKDLLSFDEMQHISEIYFENLTGPPAEGVLKEFPNADKFDKQIRGWVRYWNEILKPDEILNANLIKALIATESSFDQNSDNKTKNVHARGLMQIRDQTLHILGDHKGELKDYLIHLAANNLLDPSANICAGVRWLFQKKKLASARLKRTATWEEAIIEYKGYWDEVGKGNDPKPMQHLREYFNRLQKGT